MTDIRESIRHVFDPVPEVGLDEIMAASRRRHRRHRWIVGVGGGLSAAVAVIVVAALAVGGANPTNVTTSPSPTQPVTSSVSLPTQGSFEQITTTPAGDLLLSGTSNTTVNAAPRDCITATVDPQTLAISKPAVIPCADPTSQGHKVGMVTHYRKGGPTGLEADVTIATVTRTGQVVEGPVVMTYTDCSDCRPVSVYGDGLLWIYDNSTPNGGELIEVSDTTGAVISTISMPKLFRPLLAANDQGLFIANSLYGGRAADEPPPSALYHLAPGEKTPAVVVADTSLLACWLTADSTHLWIGMGNQHQGCAQETIWRLDGNNFQPVFETPTDLNLSYPVGDQTGGLWTIVWPHSRQSASLATTTPRLIYIDPATGTATLSATLPPIGVNSYLDGMQPNSATLLHGYLYVLEPPVGSTGGYRTLLRIDTTTPAATGTITTAPPTTASASNATVVLRGSGVNDIAFGTIQASAITELDKLLGPPSSTAPLNQFGGCGIDSTMQWPTLTAYFSRGAFVGYSTLAANGTTLPSGNQATTKGLRAGDQLHKPSGSTAPPSPPPSPKADHGPLPHPPGRSRATSPPNPTRIHLQASPASKPEPSAVPQQRPSHTGQSRHKKCTPAGTTRPSALIAPSRSRNHTSRPSPGATDSAWRMRSCS